MVKDNIVFPSTIEDRSKAIRVFEPKGEVQLTLSHWQQSELEFHVSNMYDPELLNAE